MKTMIVLSLVIVTAGITPSPAADTSTQNFTELALLDCSGRISLTLDQLTHDAIAEDRAKAEDAIRMLRARGPEGLRALLEANAAILNLSPTISSRFATTTPDESLLRVRAALDGVSGQRDCQASHLYWYTDFEQAKVAAKAEAKPILSLRLLGRLDEEFSCANSRFFRTTLYANAEVSEYLREHFVLHWKSVRPVPRITIDMGDGRKIERTITGNSIHYILDANGHPIDALPGLYGAKAFLNGLNRAETAERQAAQLNGTDHETLLKNYHETRLAEIQDRWSRDLAAISGPDAITSAPDALSKFADDRDRLDASSTDATWKAIAALHANEARLDGSAYALVASKQSQEDADKAMRATASKMIVESPMMRMIRNLERSIAEDTVRNEYQMHTRILEWFVNGSAPQTVDALNQKVYAELFLTPDSDPWLGLVPADTFSALDHGGLVEASVKP